jgi:hypothetical protein
MNRMNGIENAQHDLSDAHFCLETAIELLSSIGHDAGDGEADLVQLVEQLRSLKTGLDSSRERLIALSDRIPC